jgi:hypothetical protein
MSRRSILLMKALYLVALATLAASMVLLIDQGIDVQVDALPHYAAVWNG